MHFDNVHWHTSDFSFFSNFTFHEGNKGLAFQAIQQAKAGEFAEAESSLNEASEQLREAHDVQTDLLTRLAQGEKIGWNLYMVHAQDHLMNAITFKDLAVEVVGQEQRLQALENK